MRSRKKKRQTRHGKRGASKESYDDDRESFTWGPITVERVGRLTRFRSHMEPDEHREFVEKRAASRPKLREDLNALVREAIAIASEWNLLPTLGALYVENCTVASLEGYSEPEHEGIEARVEYALSLVAATCGAATKPEPTGEVSERFAEVVDKILRATDFYFATEASEDPQGDLDQQEVRYKALLHFLFFRGPSFLDHHLELMREVFEPHDDFFVDRFGFSASELIDGALEIPPALSRARFFASSKIPTNLTKGTSSDASRIFGGEFSHLWILIRNQLQIEVLRERYMDQLQYGFVGWLRYDIMTEQDGSHFGYIDGVTA